MSKLGCASFHPPNVGCPDMGVVSDVAGVVHVGVVAVLGTGPDTSPGLVHKGTLSVIMTVRVSVWCYGCDALAVPNCKEVKDYGEGGSSTGVLSVGCASTADDATSVGISACELADSTCGVGVILVGAATVTDC